ncbi:MAG: thermonuclease [Actinomycetia bacterium]|nr:thermonuclease [Actinomycetes bacterium]
MVPGPLSALRLLTALTILLVLSSCTLDGTSSRATEVGSDPAPTSNPTSPATTRPRATAVVDRVVDGDTLVLVLGGEPERVRLIGIDTPESVAETRPNQCFGVEASLRMSELLPEGTEVWITRDVEARDQYGRLLAYVHRTSDDLFVNLAMVEEGYAGVFTFPPNVTYADLFVEAAARAREADLGLWGACGGPDVDL